MAINYIPLFYSYRSILRFNLPRAQSFSNFIPQVNQYDHTVCSCQPADLLARHQSVENARLDFF